MRTIFTFFFIVPLLFIKTNAQINTFEKVYSTPNGCAGYSVLQLEDSNFVLTGNWSVIYGIVDLCILKVDTNGNILWNKFFPSSRNNSDFYFGYSIIETFDKGFAAVGYTEIPYQFYLIRTNTNGDTLWTKNYNSAYLEIAYDIKQTSDSGFIIVGHIDSLQGKPGKLVIMKTNANGDSLWSRVYGQGFYAGTNYNSNFRSVQITEDGGNILLGSNSQLDTNLNDIYLVRTDSNGDTLWTKSYGGANDDIGMCVQKTKDNGFIITGATMSFGNGGYDAYLIKTDSSGAVLWSKTFGGLDDDWGDYVYPTSDSGYIISGSTQSFSHGGYDVYLIKTDKNGNLQWYKTFGGVNNDIGYCVKQTFDNGFIIVGIRGNYIYLIKTDENGVLTSTNEISISSLYSGISIYPNPLTSSSILQLSTQLKDAEVVIYDVVGKEILRKKFAPSNPSFGGLTGDRMEIEKGSLESGVYFVKVVSEDRQWVEKLVVE